MNKISIIFTIIGIVLCVCGSILEKIQRKRMKERGLVMQNEIFEDIAVTDEVTEEISENEETVQEDEVLLADYYDNYYNSVLKSLDNIEKQQNTIIENEETIIACHQTHNTSFSTISFLLGLLFVYIFIKSIMK